MRTIVVFLFAFMAAESQTRYEVRRSDGTVAPSLLPPEVLFDLRSASPAAQQTLLPLYQREWALEQDLSTVRWAALGDTLRGLAKIGGSTIGIGGAGSRVVDESAAVAGTPGSKFKGENAALSAKQPADMYESVNKAMYLVNQI